MLCRHLHLCVSFTSPTSSFQKYDGFITKRRNRDNRIRNLKLDNVKKSALLFGKLIAEDPKQSNMKDFVAKAIGYVMGFGSIGLYSPIVYKLLVTKSSEGLSAQTWVFNLIGMLASVLYPFKKGFPISTYLETVSTTIQTLGILGLICFYGGNLTSYLVAMFAVAVVGTWIQKTEIPPKALNSVQALAIIANTYALIPQIWLTVQTKKTSYSWITAALSAAGCFVRILTTMQLTKDRLLMAGFSLGFLNNVIVLLQVYKYGSN